MNSPPETFAGALAFGLVCGSIVLAWMTSVLLGGWKFGSLLRRIEVRVERSQLGVFMERLHRRIAELGFKPSGVPGRYFQGGSAFENPKDFAAFTHAKTSKQLDIALDHSAPETVGVQLSLQYRDPILGDTGESAYRDEVFDYISGKIDAMKVIPNRSFAAVASGVGGIVSLLAFVVLKAMAMEPKALKECVIILGCTYLTISLISLVAVSLKRGQSTGIGFAVVGILTSVMAVLAAALTH